MNEPVPANILCSSELKIITEQNINIAFEKKIIIGVCLHNNTDTIKECINSIIEQDIFNRCAVVLLDDLSSDNWDSLIKKELALPNVIHLRVNSGSPARSRNMILDFVDNNFDSPKWIARLDADDKFTTKTSLSMMCKKGDEQNSSYIIGGNRLVKYGKIIDKVNYASNKLFNKDYLLKILFDMSGNNAYNELPSCNLILKAKTGFRYPDIQSAEDHWLISQLVFFHSSKGLILEDFLYCDYTLNGKSTLKNKEFSNYQKIRQELYQAFLMCKNLNFDFNKLLGYGQEGVVLKEEQIVKKYFYPNKISTKQVEYLSRIIEKDDIFIPKTVWIKNSLSWVCTYKYFDSYECKVITLEQVKEFLLFCLNKNIVCMNIKRSNFKMANNKLVYIDIGNSICPMDIRYFIDSAARLYAIATLNYTDYELVRRKNIYKLKQDEVLNQIPGFLEFYNALILSYVKSNINPFLANEKLYQLKSSNECTLMIKVCAMDYEIIKEQVKHIVLNLEVPRNFVEKILLIDSHEDNFLRQYQKADLNKIYLLAKELKEENFIDRIIISPNNKSLIKELNTRWFGLNCEETHSVKRAPVFSQIWGFEQVKTRYLLQCDIDVLIGKKNISHDYLNDMLTAIKHQDVIGVAFNIPHDIKKGFREYNAPPGDYVPEVRCGLLDLKLIKDLFPLVNEIENGKLQLSWFRSLHKTQIKYNKKTLRGGDPQTFYIHPQNNWKKDIESFFQVQDLVNQVKIPDFQLEKWDLEGCSKLWNYEKRDEEIVFLIKGRDTIKEKINRCLASLKMQTDQEFGVIIIDDCSDNLGIEIPTLLGSLLNKTTLIRNHKNKGRMPNLIRAISEVCANKTSLIVILDFDDALIDPNVVLKLKSLVYKGYDLIQGGMFRPNKALKLYIPSYENCREKFGGNVWVHLRAFKKSLFDQLDTDVLKLENEWIPECTDYATMIPLVELSENPIFIPEYWYLHENSTKRTPENQVRKNDLINKIIKSKLLLN